MHQNVKTSFPKFSKIIYPYKILLSKVLSALLLENRRNTRPQRTNKGGQKH